MGLGIQGFNRDVRSHSIKGSLLAFLRFAWSYFGRAR